MRVYENELWGESARMEKRVWRRKEEESERERERARVMIRLCVWRRWGEGKER